MPTASQLAKELGLSIEELLSKAASIDPDITAGNSDLDEDVESYVRDSFKDILKKRRAEEREAKRLQREAEKQRKAEEKAKAKQEKAKEKAVNEAPAEDETAKEKGKRKARIAPDVDQRLKPVLGGTAPLQVAPEEPPAPVEEVAPVAEEDEDVEPPVEDVEEDGGEEADVEEVAPEPVVGKRKPSIMDELRKPVFVKRASPVPEAKKKKPGPAVDAASPVSTSRKTGSETFKINKDGDDRRRGGKRMPTGRGRIVEDDRPSRGGRRKMRAAQQERRTQDVLRELSGSTVQIQMPITVKGLSNELGLKSSEILKALLKHGVMVTLNDPLPAEMVEQVGLDLGVLFELTKAVAVEDVLDFEKEADLPESLVLRPPVVAILGHVDHGKTTLLDFIRKTDKAKHEVGGITQHIGAYKVKTEKGHDVVILDTPGHQAFSEMRSRGADITDIVVLVVAADDGVMPQTVESIDHARAAGVPIVVAVNKIDKPNANPERVLQQLTGLGLQPEAWGGETICCMVSALNGQGVEDMLELLWLQAEVLELKANPDRPAQGTVIEAEITEDRGVVAKALIQRGTLRKGDVVLIGGGFGKVKGMYDDYGDDLDTAGPSTPVAITGLNRMPMAGDRVHVLPSMQDARAIAEDRMHKERERDLTARRHVTLENLFSHIASEQVKEVRIVLKADVTGSVEVLKKSLYDLSTEEVRIKILHASVGGVNESDVILADASDALVIGFHVGVENKARILAAERKVEIKAYQIIYDVTREMKLAMEGMLEPEQVEEVTGHVEVRAVFKTSRLGNIAGCFVADGVVKNNSRVRLLRDNVVIYPLSEAQAAAGGRLASLRRIKDDVKEVKEGFECGLRIDGFDDIQVGDVVEAFEMKSVKRTLA